MASVDRLDDVLGAAASVRVTEAGVFSEQVRAGQLLVEADDPAALRRLRQALAVERLTGGHCMCLGDLALEFFDPAGQRVAVVGFHHGITVRWSGWDSDALLRDGDQVLHWLAERSADGPRARQERQRREEGKAALARERWLAAAPAAVRHYADAAVMSGSPEPELSVLVADHVAEVFPDPVERAAALLIWYGSGSGRCTGFPSYEDLPERALAGMPIADIIAALQVSPVDARVDAGAVRHLCGWKSRKNQKRDVARLPPEVRARLLASARVSGDDDKRRRAESWLAS